MEFLANVASGFIALFEEGGAVFMDLVTGIIPTLVVLMTAVNAVVKLIGEQKVERAARMCSKNIILRYTILPLLAVIFLANPMGVTFGRFLEEKYKPSYADAWETIVHPITGLFPHANSGELFVWLGISNGIAALGISTGGLAVRYLLVGIIMMLVRGVVTENLFAYFASKSSAKSVKGGVGNV